MLYLVKISSDSCDLALTLLKSILCILHNADEHIYGGSCMAWAATEPSSKGGVNARVLLTYASGGAGQL